MGLTMALFLQDGLKSKVDVGSRVLDGVVEVGQGVAL